MKNTATTLFISTVAAGRVLRRGHIHSIAQGDSASAISRIDFPARSAASMKARSASVKCLFFLLVSIGSFLSLCIDVPWRHANGIVAQSVGEVNALPLHWRGGRLHCLITDSTSPVRGASRYAIMVSALFDLSPAKTRELKDTEPARKGGKGFATWQCRQDLSIFCAGSSPAWTIQRAARTTF